MKKLYSIFFFIFLASLSVYAQPAISSLDPLDDATGVALDKSISITFDVKVEPVANGGSVYIRKTADSTAVDSFVAFTDLSWSPDSMTVSFQSAFLAELTEYSIIIPDTIFRDKSTLQAFPGILTLAEWSFTTGEFTPPTATAFYPGSGNTNINPDTVLSIKFDETVAIASDGFIQIVLTSDSTVVENIDVATAAVVSTGDSVVITPTALVDSESYSVIIPDSVILDAFGNYYVGVPDKSGWSFSTGDYTAPLAVNLYPGNGSIDITFDSTLVITFNELVSGAPGGFVYVMQQDSVQFDAIDVSGFGSSDSVVISVATFLEDSTYSIIIPEGAFEDGNGNAYAGINDLSTWSFTIGDFTAPSVTAVYPMDENSNINPDTALYIKFDEDLVLDPAGTITIRRTPDLALVESISLGSGAVTLVGSDSVRVATSLLVDTTRYTITFSGDAFSDASGNYVPALTDTSVWNFSTGDYTAPLAENFYPANGSIDIAVDSTLVITFNETVSASLGGGDIYIIDITAGDSVLFQTLDINSVIPVSDVDSVAFSAGLSFSENTSYAVIIPEGVIVDGNNNAYAGIGDTTVWNFTIGDFTAPSYTNLYPADESVNIRPDSVLKIKFTEPIQLANDGFITIFNSPDSTEVFSLSILSPNVNLADADSSVTITAALSDTTRYAVVIPDSVILDGAGFFFAGIQDTTLWNFETGDYTAPLAENFYPGNGAIDIAVDSTLVITFNEPVTGVGSVYVMQQDSSIYETIDVSGIINTDSVVISAAVFLEDSTYSIYIPDGAFVDANNNSYAGINDLSTWSFTIGDFTVPSVLNFYPANGDVDITKDTTLSVKFDDVVQPSDDGSIYLVYGDSSNFEAIPIASVNFSGDSIYFSHSLFLDDSTYAVIIPDTVITDDKGNFFGGVNDLATWSFTIGDFTAPIVEAVYPMDGATGITNDSTLSIKFNEPVQKGSGNITIVLTSSPGTIIETIDVNTPAVTISGDSVTISHALLSDVTDYSIIVPGSTITDLSGNAFAGINNAGDWNFETGDFTPPVISNVSIEIYRADSIGLDYEFGEIGRLYYTINDSDFNPDSTEVFTPIGNVSSGDTAVSVDNTPLTLNIDLQGLLTNGTEYFIAIVSEDSVGNLSAVQKYSWTADDVAPNISVLTLQPVSNTGIELNYQVNEFDSIYFAIFEGPAIPAPDSLELRNKSSLGSVLNDGFAIAAVGSTQTQLIEFSFTDATQYYIYVTSVDTANNLGIVQSLNWTADGTPPTIELMTIFDNDNDGFIDSLILDFSEPVVETGSTPVLGTDFNLEMPDDSLAISAIVTDPLGSDIVTIYNIVGQKVPNTAADSILIYGLTGIWEDLALNDIVVDSYNHTIVADSASPVILGSFLPLSNNYLDVTFSEEVYNTDTASLSGTIENEFAFTFIDDGDGTTASVTSITLVDGTTEPSIFGEDVLRFNLSVGGTDPSGDETIEIGVNTASVYDAYHNVVYDTISTGLINLFNKDPRITKSATHNSISSVENTSTGAIVFEFDITNILASDLLITGMVFEKGTSNTVSDWTDVIAGARLKSGNDVSFATIYSDSIKFTGLGISGNDVLGKINKPGGNGNPVVKTYEFNIWLNTSITDSVNLDDQILQFELSGNDMTYNDATTLLETDSANSDAVDIEVIATELVALEEEPVQFQRQSSNTMTIVGTDVNGNFDLGFSTTVNVNDQTIVAGTFTGTSSVLMVNDTALFTDLNIDQLGTGNVLRFSASGFSNLDVTVDVVDNIGPSKVAVYPAEGATGIELTDTLVLKLDETIEIQTGKIYLVRDAVPPTITEIDVTDATQVFASNDSLYVVPTDPLVGNSDYYLLADSGIISDNILATNLFAGISSATEWYFSTTTVDNLAPILTITRNTPATGTPDATREDSVTFALKFNEQINTASFTAADIMVNPVGLTYSSGPTIIATGDKKNFTVTIAQIDNAADGYLSIEVGPAITDLAGNPMSSAVTSASFKIDRVAPAADSIAISSNNALTDSLATTSDDISLYLRFDEPVGANPSLVFKSGGVAVVNAVSITPVNDSTFTADYTVSPSDVQGEVTFSVTFVDSAGNQTVHASTTDGSDMFMDRTVPSVTLSTSEPATTNADPFVAVATFSEGIIGFTQSDLDSTNCTIDSIVLVSPNVYNIYVNPDDNITSSVTLKVRAGTVTDSVGLANTVSNTLNVSFDDVPPAFNSKTANAVSTTGINFDLELDQLGTVYYMLKERGVGTVPDTSDVVDRVAVTGHIADGVTSTGTIFDFTITGLNATTAYDLYIVAVDPVGNESAVDSIIDVRTIPSAPTLTENPTGLSGDTSPSVAMYRTFRNLNPSGNTPVNIFPTFDGNTITIYGNSDLDSAIFSIGSASLAGEAPQVADFFADSAAIGLAFSDLEDDNGIYTFYITQTNTGNSPSQSAAKKYSIALLDNIGNSRGVTVYTNDDQVGTTLGVGNHPSADQEVTFSGAGLSGYDYSYVAGDTSYVDFIPADASTGLNQISVRWFNLISNVSATFLPGELNFTVNAVSSVFVVAGPASYCKVDDADALPINPDPDGVDVLTDGDGSDPDFHTVEVYYIRNGKVDNTIAGAKVGVLSNQTANIADLVITYDSALVSNLNADFGNPHSTDLWDFRPSALYEIGGFSGQEIDTLVFATIISDDTDSLFTVLGTEFVYLYPDPTTTITNVNEYYCEDDGSFDITATVVAYTGGPTTSGVISNGYLLERHADAFYSGPVQSVSSGGSALFDPSNPFGGGPQTGYYRIIYQSNASVNGGCVGADTADFQILTKPVEPEVDETAYTSIGTLSSGEYLFEYCGGDDILDISILTAGVDTVLWYLDAGGVDVVAPENVSGTQGETLSVLDEFFGGSIPTQNRTRQVWVSVITDKNINGSGYDGCESDLRHITIQVYTPPNTIVIDDALDAVATNETNLGTFTVSPSVDTIDATGYIYEYCVDGGAAATLEDIVVNSGLNGTVSSESYFTIYNSAFSPVDSFGVTDLTGGTFDGDLIYNPSSAPLSLSLVAGEKDTFYISRTDYDNNYPIDPDTAAFSGCESDLRMFTISVFDIPDAPVNANFKGGENTASRQALPGNVIQYYMCSGDENEFVQLESPGVTGSVYTWYTDNGGPDVPIPVEAFNGRLITIDELETFGGFDDSLASTYTYWVTQTREASNTTDFLGCESSPTQVDITVYPDPSPVLFTNGGAQDLVISACTDEIASTFITATGVVPSTFKWYLSNAGRTIESSSAIYTQLYSVSPGAFGQTTASGANLQLSTINKDSTVYFLVSQTNNIAPNGSTFGGCESELANMAYLTFNVFDIPATPTTADQTLFYCDDDVVNSITVSGEATTEYNWFVDDGTGFPAGGAIHTTSGSSNSTITDAELGLDAGVNTPGVYKYLVSQTSDIGGGGDGTFLGCESPYLSISITVVGTPAAPGVADPLPQCEPDVTPSSTVISYTGSANIQGTTEFVWYADDMTTELDRIATTTPTAKLTYTPSNIEDYVASPTDTLITIYVSQVLNIVSGEGFSGCESAMSRVDIIVYPEPSKPSTVGNVEANTYVFCEGDDFTGQTVDIFNPQGDEVYTWYQTSTGSNVINTGPSISFINDLDGISLDGKAFSVFNNVTDSTQGTYNFYVSRTQNIRSDLGFTSGCEGPRETVTIKLQPKPDNMAFVGLSSTYCYDDDVVNISSTARIEGTNYGSVTDYLNSYSGGSATITVTSGGTSVNIDNGDGTATFDPSDLADAVGEDSIGNTNVHQLTLQITTEQGCIETYSQSFTIYPKPDISLQISEAGVGGAVVLGPTRPEDHYYMSVRGGNVLLQGWDFDANFGLGGRLTSGTFTSNGIAIGQGEGVGVTTTGEALFDPNGTDGSGAKTNLYSPAESFEIYYNAVGPNDCENTIMKNLTVLPVPEFTDYIDGNGNPRKVKSLQICLTQDVILEAGIDNLADLGVSFNNVHFNWYARAQGAELDTLVMGDVQHGTYTVDVDKTGTTCKIQFTNAFDENLNTPGYPNLEGTVDFIVEAYYSYTAPHGDVVPLNVTPGEAYTLGNTPQPKMRWDSTTVGSNTIVYFSDDIGAEQPLDDMLFSVINVNNSTDTLYNYYRDSSYVNAAPGNTIRDSLVLTSAEYSFAAGEYMLSLEYNTTSQCNATETRYITINDHVALATGAEFIETFEGGPGGWYINDISYSAGKLGFDTLDITTDQSWELAPTTTFGDLNTSTCWVTNATTSYLAEEQSWVYSPTYDLSALLLPTIGVTYASYMDPKDGVVLQYSTDDGVTWNALGSYTLENGTSGKNWYNRQAINASPGNADDIFVPGTNVFNPQVYGWSFAGGRVGFPDENEVKWRAAAHKLDAIVGLDHIRFRFALGASTGQKTDNVGTPYYGFAFDDFKLYDREKIIVIEQFTSLADSKSKLVDEEIDNRITNTLGSDALVINYFTSLVDQPDPLNAKSKNYTSARSLYYGIEEVPRSVIAGQIQTGNLNATNVTDIMGWNINRFNEIALDEAGFDIGDIVIGGSEQQITISTTFTSNVNLPAETEVSFRFAIVEDSIAGQDINTTYSTPLINNALRVMLPSASGMTYVGEVTQGQTDFGLDLSTLRWTINDVYDASNLAVIVFVQLDTEVDSEAGLGKGIILQSKKIAVPAGKIEPASNQITATAPEKGNEFSVFPNPSDDEFMIRINGFVADDMDWTLYDQSGREVKQGLIRKGQETITVGSSEVPSGLYMLRLYNKDILWEPKRLMIIHQ
ncbi:Ig-like domain-containing protein [Marinoscillum sp. MHG1-6]|uniref:Ig-like domain-containing protein n=1 Tax=Marinoscillum sp. MHG1-6 TaxID=2959627 RepID=UPI0021580755|nr:Ig-like domain-containing protein [Marinoscillum sp. MHG1-6]